MADVSTGTRVGARDWGSDFFGTLDETPPEPVTGIGQILESMHTLPAFHDARDWVLRHLALSRGSSVIEAGCGTGASLPDILAVVGPDGRVVGVDPTFAFVDSARSRAARLGAASAHYEVGDIRSLPSADGAFDAAFCEKVLIHAGPARAALDEMARVTRVGGRVGALEWLPFFAATV